MWRKGWLLFLTGVLVFLGACGGVEEAPRPAPAPTSQPPRLQSVASFSVELISENGEPHLPEHPLRLRFNQPVRLSSSSAPIQVYPYVPGALDWNSQADVLSFFPSQPLDPGRQYRVFLDPDLRAQSGSKLDSAGPMSFEVASPPRVEGHSPDESSLSSRRPTIRLEFSREMEPISVQRALSLQPKADFDVVWPNDRVLEIHMNEPLIPGTRYRFTLDDSAADRVGLQLEEAYVWSYWLEPLRVELTGPTFEHRQGPFQLDFNYPVDRRSVDASITIEPSLEAEYVWSAQGNRLVVKPEGDLTSGQAYSFTFTSPLRDPEGHTYPFVPAVTHPALPPIAGLHPRPDEEIDGMTQITIEFDQPISRSSAEAAFGLDPHLPGHFSWDGDSMTYTFEVPPAAWTAYTASLGVGLRSAGGEPLLTEPFVWTFHAMENEARVVFSNSGTNVQLVQASGSRRVQYGVGSSRPTRVTFGLHDISLQELASIMVNDPSVQGHYALSLLDEAEEVHSWQVVTGVPGDDQIVRQVEIPGEIEPGAYVLTASTGGVLQDQLLLFLSDNTLMVKRAGSQVLAWVTDFQGSAAVGTEVRVYADDGRHLREGNTDEHGVYRTVLNPGDRPLLVLARDAEGGVAASAIAPGWSSGAGDYWWWWRPRRVPDPQVHMAYVYTDRPIYRPGQTVYFKAFIRQDDDGELSLPEPETLVTARIRDPRSNLLRTYELSTSALGSVDGEFLLAEGGTLGDYQIELTIQGERHTQLFKVEDYRKPDLRVEAVPDKPAYVVGEDIRLQVDVMYLFGEPVEDAELTFQFYELGQYYDWWFDDTPESDEVQYTWFHSYRQAINASTDEQGRYLLRLPAELGTDQYRRVDWASSRESTLWGIEVAVDDGSRQSISGFAVVEVFNAAEQLSLETRGHLQAPGESFIVQARAQSLQAEPVANRSLLLEVRGWNKGEYDYSEVIQVVDAQTKENGLASIEVNIAEPGYYQLLLSGTDKHGNRVNARRWVYLYRQGDRWVRPDLRDAVSISSPRTDYKPYERAELVIETTFAGPALLTFERGSTRRVKPIELKPPITLVEVPILESDAPNIFVTLSAWKRQSTELDEWTFYNLPESRLLTDSLELRVEASGKRLNVSMHSDAEEYRPGEEAEFTIEVTDSRGQGVQAELVLALVDEAIFELSDELAGPVYEAFYGPRPHLVRTYDALSPHREIYEPGRGGGGGDGLGTPGQPRSEFQDTAAWWPSVMTDENGRAVVSVRLPDNITSWRLTAKAVTSSTRVGEATYSFATRKPIMIRPIMPRTTTAGDDVMLSAAIHNYGQAGKIDVTLNAIGLTVNGQPQRSLRVPRGEVVVVGWPARITGTGEVQLTISAEAEGAADAVRLSLPVQPLAIPDVYTQVGQFETDFETTFMLPLNALPQSSLTVELSRSIGGSLLNGLDYLTGFPYGCVEQTMSRALPNAVVGRAYHQLGMPDASGGGELSAKIQAGIQRLYGFQHEDGGWGWWYDDLSHDYQTAWVVFGLAVTAQAGYEVDPEVLARGSDWLAGDLKSMDPRTRAYALYSMAIAGHGDAEATRALAERAAELDAFSLAALALASHELGEVEQAEALLGALEASAVLGGDVAYWPTGQEDGHYYDKTMASSTRSTALALSAFVRIAPEHELVPRIARWLMDQRRGHGWGTTNETAYTLLALTDYLLAAEEAGGATQVFVELNGESVLRDTLGPGRPMASLELPAAKLVSGVNNLSIRQTGELPLYFIIQQRIYLSEANLEPQGNLRVEREYFGRSGNIALSSVQAGELVLVRLKVTAPQDVTYLLLEDHLPAGLEALNERLNTTSRVVDTYAYGPGSSFMWQDLGYNMKEVHGDRVTFFVSEMSQGQHAFTYLARATHTGSFTALPAEAWAMYNLRVWGRSGADSFAVIPGD